MKTLFLLLSIGLYVASCSSSRTAGHLYYSNAVEQQVALDGTKSTYGDTVIIEDNGPVGKLTTNFRKSKNLPDFLNKGNIYFRRVDSLKKKSVVIKYTARFPFLHKEWWVLIKKDTPTSVLAKRL